jgi:hypothetical protein
MLAREKDIKSTRAKISPGFAARLEQLEPEENVCAIVVLKTDDSITTPAKRRPKKLMRRHTARIIRKSSNELLPKIDRILKRHHGKRLKSDADVLGSIPVITTPAGIEALTASEYVKAIFEDQRLLRVG